MCTMKCLMLSVRLVRNGIGYPVSNRPQIARYVSSAFYTPKTFINSTHRRNLISTGCCTNMCKKGCYTLPSQVECLRLHSTQTGNAPSEDGEPPKLNLFQRYKKMLKEYWYVLIPVHCVTSAIWFGSFYYAATCGVDIVPLLEYLGVSEEWIKPLRSSSLGYLAVASAFYKLATPARYAVTVGGTTLAIRVLTARGLIKPMPSKAKMKEIVKQRTDHFMSRKASQH